MKRSEAVLIILFICTFIIDSFLAGTGNLEGRYLSKGLLMPLLLVYFFVATNTSVNDDVSKSKLYIYCALLFSCIGDIFLLGQGSLNFMCGIGAFLIAQVFYILFFITVRRLHKNNTVFIFVAAIFILAYLITLNSLLWQKVHAQQFVIPVFAYSIALGLMLFAAINTYNATLRNNIARYFISGAIIFVLSDSMIALNNFYLTKPLPGFYIMFTYCLAQFLLVTGAVKFIRQQ